MSTTKLTMSDVIDIRRLHSLGNTTSTLAEEFGVAARHIRRVVDGTAWSEVPDDKRIKNFINYAITADGRVFSLNANKYLTTEVIAGKPYVRLSKTTKSGERVRQKVAIETLLKTYF